MFAPDQVRDAVIRRRTTRGFVRREVEVRGAERSRGCWPDGRRPGIGITVGRECELPGEDDLLHADPSLVGDPLERRVAGAHRGVRPMPPSGDQGRNAMPSSAQCSSSARLDRKVGENWFCTETSRPPRMSLARSICSTLAFDRVRRLRRSRRSPGSARTAYRSPVGARLERPGRARYSLAACSSVPAPRARTMPSMLVHPDC